MDELFFQVLEGAFALPVILYTTVGVFLGITVGAIPGLSGDMAIALLLPLIYKVSPAAALGMLMGIYKGSMFGGSISAISFGVPGTAAAAATVEDGYPAKLKGHPKQAMLTALYSSVTGDLISTLLLVFVAVPMAKVALHFGPVEFFALYVFALMMISLLVVGEMKKGIAAAAIGLFIGTIGMDPMMGSVRLTFGISSLRGGIPLIPLLVGVFAVSELMIQFGRECASRSATKMAEDAQKAEALGVYDPAKDRMSLKIYWSTFRATLIGSGMGTFIGALPGAGGPVASIIAYDQARKSVKNPTRPFGEGAVEGVIASEAANNACIGGALIPMLTLAVPGDAVTAVMLAAFYVHGLQPGPLLFVRTPELFSVVLAAGFLACFAMLLLGMTVVPRLSGIVLVPKRILMPLVTVLSVVGTYAVNSSMFDVGLMFCFGLAGFLMRSRGYPAAPLVLGLVLGEMMDSNLRRAVNMAMAGDSVFLELFGRPSTVVLSLMVAFSVLAAVPAVKERIGAAASRLLSVFGSGR